MKTVLRNVLMLIPVVLMLLLILGLGLASLQGPKILWTAIDGELVTRDLAERSHVCHVDIRARDGGLLRYSLDGDICAEPIGSRIHKAPWSITVRSTSGKAYGQLGPVLAGTAGVLWTAFLGSLLFYSAFVRPVLDWRGGSRALRPMQAVEAHHSTMRRIPRWLLAWRVVAMGCTFVAVFFGFVIVAIGEDQPRGAWNYPVSIPRSGIHYVLPILGLIQEWSLPVAFFVMVSLMIAVYVDERSRQAPSARMSVASVARSPFQAWIVYLVGLGLCLVAALVTAALGIIPYLLGAWTLGWAATVVVMRRR